MGERKNSYKRIILMCYHQKIIIIILLLGRLLKNLLLVTFSFIILKILNRKKKSPGLRFTNYIHLSLWNTCKWLMVILIWHFFLMKNSCKPAVHNYSVAMGDEKDLRLNETLPVVAVHKLKKERKITANVRDTGAIGELENFSR